MFLKALSKCILRKNMYQLKAGVRCLFICAFLCASGNFVCFLLTIFVYYFYGYMCCGDACGAVGIQLVGE
jgi:hypothetical protein